jgi:hypothetical protein
LCPKIQIPSTKLQINPQAGKSQIFTLFGFLNFGHWNLFDHWDLLFGISISQ